MVGSLMALLIGISPYIFYLYEIFPNSPVWENSFFSYQSKYYEDVLTAAWTYLGKFVPLYLLIIWFITCKHWWYHIILVPILMYAYQLTIAFYEDAYMDQRRFMDTDDLLYIAPVIIGIFCLVYLIRLKIFDRIYGIDLSELEETNVSVFSQTSKKDYQDLEDFRRENTDMAAEEEEDYYKKL